MVDKFIDFTKDERAAHEAKWGRFNDTLPGWREVTEGEIARSNFASHSPVAREYRQIRSDDGKPMLAVTLYFMHDGTGVGMHFDYWGQKVRWFKFGCAHKYVGLSQEECRAAGIYHGGRCYHVSKCSECGHVNAVDSSD